MFLQNFKMKILLSIFFSGCFFAGIIEVSTAQNISRAANQQEVDYIELPPLSAMIDSAIMNNAMVKLRNLEIDSKATNVKSQRNYWYRNVGIQADTRYGTFDNFSTNTSEGQTPSIYASRTSQFNYGVGAYLKVPLYDILNHKNQVDQAKIEHEMAARLADAQRDDLRQVVIKNYNDVILSQRLLNIASQNLGNYRVNMEMVEKEFQNGTIPVSEYVNISDEVSRAEADYESARISFITAYMILEEIIGFKLKTKININGNENN
jgi:outer membrane protein TolC